MLTETARTTLSLRNAQVFCLALASLLSGCALEVAEPTATTELELADQFDATPAWPLCGRISASPPAGWTAAQGCPSSRFGSSNHTDFPLSATFGPRQKVPENNRYDYHRGLDIGTPANTPVFAITSGVVQIAGAHSSYEDPLVQLRHYRPGATSCSGGGGCYYSNYMHLSSWVVSPNQSVTKGQLIGYTGSSMSGYDHLHFEVRSAPAFDSVSAWQRDAIHPLKVLPYAPTGGASIVFDSVNLSNPNSPVVKLTATMARRDIAKIDLRLYTVVNTGGLPYLFEVPQTGNTPNAKGYNVEPSFLDFETANFQYSHKNSTTYSWSSFGLGGTNECPYHAAHGAAYDANVHLDNQLPGNTKVGSFNGITIAPAPQGTSAANYVLSLTFNELQGPAGCFIARAYTTKGQLVATKSHGC